VPTSSSAAHVHRRPDFVSRTAASGVLVRSSVHNAAAKAKRLGAACQTAEYFCRSDSRLPVRRTLALSSEPGSDPAANGSMHRHDRTSLRYRRPTIAGVVLSALLTLAFGIYFSRATHALRNVLVALQSRPYHEMRQSRHNVKLQVRAF